VYHIPAPLLKTARTLGYSLDPDRQAQRTVGRTAAWRPSRRRRRYQECVPPPETAAKGPAGALRFWLGLWLLSSVSSCKCKCGLPEKTNAETAAAAADRVPPQTANRRPLHTSRQHSSGPRKDQQVFVKDRIQRSAPNTLLDNRTTVISDEEC